MPVIHLHSGTWQMKRQAILLSSTFSDFKGAALVIEEAPEILGIVLLFFFVLAFGRVTLCVSHLSFFRKSIYGWVLFSQTWLMTSDNSEYRSCLAHQCYLPNNQSPKGTMLSGQTTSHGTVSFFSKRVVWSSRWQFEQRSMLFRIRMDMVYFVCPKIIHISAVHLNK